MSYKMCEKPKFKKKKFKHFIVKVWTILDDINNALKEGYFAKYLIFFFVKDDHHLVFS